MINNNPRLRRISACLPRGHAPMAAFALACAMAVAGSSAAQDTPASIRTTEGPPANGTVPTLQKFDAAAVERGQSMLGAQCGFCHGQNARGGAGGPDLTRSPLVQEDVDGKQLGAFLRVGRPDRGMPPFTLPDDQVKVIATFLHAQIYANANRRLYTIGNILVGDPKRGEVYFNGAGGCAKCHSVTGNLNKIGSKFAAPATLQDRIVMPRGAPDFGQRATGPQYTDKNALQATVAAPGGPIKGALVRLSDFSVTLYFADSGRMQSWNRQDGKPTVTVVDPLRGHVEQLRKWTDGDLHDVTAYLAGLK
jgi:cytochrome c oxidase cbb3-type subunit 3